MQKTWVSFEKTVQFEISIADTCWQFIQDAVFASRDLATQLAMNAMDQLYGHNGGNLNVLEK